MGEMSDVRKSSLDLQPRLTPAKSARLKELETVIRQRSDNRWTISRSLTNTRRPFLLNATPAGRRRTVRCCRATCARMWNRPLVYVEDI